MTPTLADFAGSWRLTKDIADLRDRTAGTFTGVAGFTPGPEGLYYREAGTIRFGDGPDLPAERAYRWRVAGGRIAVDHADGRPFHDFDPGDARALHLCDPDRYAVVYRFNDWPDWTADWTVTGPRKDYRMLCTYRRLAR